MNWSIGFFGQSPSFLFMTHFSLIPWEKGTFMFVCVTEKMCITVCVCLYKNVCHAHSYRQQQISSSSIHTCTHTLFCNWWLQSPFDIQWERGGVWGLRVGVLKQETQDGYWYIDWMIQRDLGTDGFWGVNETYLQACWFTRACLVWFWLCVCVCVWITQVERMRNVVGCCLVLLCGQWWQRWGIQ